MRVLAWILALFLLVAGIWGFFSPVVFMFFTTNFVHACIEALLGLIGLGAARRHARGYLLWVGALLLLVGIVYFVPVASLYVTGQRMTTDALRGGQSIEQPQQLPRVRAAPVVVQGGRELGAVRH